MDYLWLEAVEEAQVSLLSIFNLDYK